MSRIYICLESNTNVSTGCFRNLNIFLWPMNPTVKIVPNLETQILKLLMSFVLFCLELFTLFSSYIISGLNWLKIGQYSAPIIPAWWMNQCQKVWVCQPSNPGSIPGMSHSETAITRGNLIMLLPPTIMQHNIK